MVYRSTNVGVHTDLPEAEVSVSENMFCNNVEEIVTVPVVQAKYYTFNESAAK